MTSDGYYEDRTRENYRRTNGYYEDRTRENYRRTNGYYEDRTRENYRRTNGSTGGNASGMYVRNVLVRGSSAGSRAAANPGCS